MIRRYNWTSGTVYNAYSDTSDLFGSTPTQFFIYTINGNVYAATGVYTDIYNASNGCDSVVETYLRVDSAVTAQISQNGVNIVTNVNGGTSPYSYIWSSGETSQSITPLANGSYWVIATDTNGCNSDTAFFMVTFIPSGIDDILNAEVNIYPNPTDGLIHINSDLKILLNLVQ